MAVSHLDLYRLAGLEREEPALLEDYLGPGRIAFVEWPHERAGELAGARLRVTLSHGGGDRRRVEVEELEATVAQRIGRAAREPIGVIVLGFDTATSATAVGLRLADGSSAELRDDPPAGAHPGHATRLLPMAERRCSAEAGIGWGELERHRGRRRARARSPGCAWASRPRAGSRSRSRCRSSGVSSLAALAAAASWTRARSRRGGSAPEPASGARRDRRAPRRGVRGCLRAGSDDGAGGADRAARARRRPSSPSLLERGAGGAALEEGPLAGGRRRRAALPRRAARRPGRPCRAAQPRFTGSRRAPSAQPGRARAPAAEARGRGPRLPPPARRRASLGARRRAARRRGVSERSVAQQASIEHEQEAHRPSRSGG